MTIGGRLGQAFGVCANALSPSDGRIVSLDHGCGAHSQTVVADGVLPVTELVIDEFEYDLIDRNSLPEPEPIDIEKLDLTTSVDSLEDIQDAVEEIDPVDSVEVSDSDLAPIDDSAESETPDQLDQEPHQQ